MPSSSPFLRMGQLGKPFGIAGWIVVHSDTRPFHRLLDYRPWYIQATRASEPEAFEELSVTDSKIQGTKIIIHIDGYDNPESVHVLTNQLIYIHRDHLPKLQKTEYYWADLEGCTVINQHQVDLGRVEHLLETGVHDVLVITGKKRCLIPFIKDKIITHVDLTKRIITVDWDEEF